MGYEHPGPLSFAPSAASPAGWGWGRPSHQFASLAGKGQVSPCHPSPASRRKLKRDSGKATRTQATLLSPRPSVGDPQSPPPFPFLSQGNVGAGAAGGGSPAAQVLASCQRETRRKTKGAHPPSHGASSLQPVSFQVPLDPEGSALRPLGDPRTPSDTSSPHLESPGVPPPPLGDAFSGGSRPAPSCDCGAPRVPPGSSDASPSA